MHYIEEDDVWKRKPAVVKTRVGYQVYPVATLCPLLLISKGLLLDRINPFYRTEFAHYHPEASSAHAWANMYLTNPPVTKVELDLCYTNSNTNSQLSTPDLCNVYASCIIRDYKGITFAALMEAPYMPGRIVIIHPKTEPWRNNDEVEVKRNSTAYEAVEACRARYGCDMTLVLEDICIMLKDVAFELSADHDDVTLR